MRYCCASISESFPFTRNSIYIHAHAQDLGDPERSDSMECSRRRWLALFALLGSVYFVLIWRYEKKWSVYILPIPHSRSLCWTAICDEGGNDVQGWILITPPLLLHTTRTMQISNRAPSVSGCLPSSVRNGLHVLSSIWHVFLLTFPPLLPRSTQASRTPSTPQTYRCVYSFPNLNMAQSSIL